MKPKALKTKELLERIFATQVLLFNRLNRIENSLSHFDPDYFDKFEGNSYRENLADIGISIAGIGAALTRPIAEPSAAAPAPVFEEVPDHGHFVMAS